MTPHGSLSTYNNHKCRCARCRQANTKYFEAYRAMKRKAGLCRDCYEKAMPGYIRCRKHHDMDRLRHTA